MTYINQASHILHIFFPLHTHASFYVTRAYSAIRRNTISFYALYYDETGYKLATTVVFSHNGNGLNTRTVPLLNGDPNSVMGTVRLICHV